ncbi:MAG: hypothetical protein ACP5O1_02655 [Phycisphaerae bacterium]
MKNIWLPAAVGALLITGCARLPNIAPPAMDNPANPAATAGKPFAGDYFLHLSDSGSDIALPEITAGVGLPGAPAAARGSPAASSGTEMKVPMGAMKGMAKSTEENQ